MRSTKYRLRAPHAESRCRPSAPRGAPRRRRRHSLRRPVRATTDRILRKSTATAALLGSVLSHNNVQQHVSVTQRTPFTAETDVPIQNATRNPQHPLRRPAVHCPRVHALLRSTCERCLRILTKPRQVYSKQTHTESFPRQPLRQQQSPSGPIRSYSNLRRLTGSHSILCDSHTVRPAYTCATGAHL